MSIIIVASALITLSIGVVIKRKKGSGHDGSRKRIDHDDDNEKVEMEEK